MSTINGYDNEYEFVKLFNNKKVCELDPISRDLIETIFHNIKEESIIKCWRNHLRQKADILLKIDNHVRGISIKKGIKNSVHSEGISYFVDFLKKEGVSNDTIEAYLLFHFADGTTNGNGKNRISTEEYKLMHSKEIEQINKEFNNAKFILASLNRFVLQGTNSNYSISAIILGEVNDYIWIDINNIKKLVLGKKDLNSSGIHIGPLQVQPKNRCLNYNSKYEKDRFCVQIKWYNLFDNYIEYKFNNNKLEI